MVFELGIARWYWKRCGRANMRIERVKWVAVLAAMLVIGIAIVLVIENRAEAKARGFCDHFPVGTSVQQAAQAARSEGDQRYRIIGANHISVAYIGATPFSRHVCTLDAQDGKVTKAGYAYID
jgi:hypothetical protein